MSLVLHLPWPDSCWPSLVASSGGKPCLWSHLPWPDSCWPSLVASSGGKPCLWSHLPWPDSCWPSRVASSGGKPCRPRSPSDAACCRTRTGENTRISLFVEQNVTFTLGQWDAEFWLILYSRSTLHNISSYI